MAHVEAELRPGCTLPSPADPPPPGTRVYWDRREAQTGVAAAQAFAPIARIGGATGWYHADWMWHIRGLLDRLSGGVGMRRGRRHPSQLNVGDPIDCWRVVALEPSRRLLLQLEMKLPGRGWLEFIVDGNGAHAQIRQTATFEARGWAGRLYWYACYPFHGYLFEGLLRQIAAAASREGARRTS